MSVVFMIIPTEIGGAVVILYSNEYRLAICSYEAEEGFFLFGCDENWGSVTDTWHISLAEAKRQAEFEYEGVATTWQSPE